MPRFKVKDLTIELAIGERQAVKEFCWQYTCSFPSELDECFRFRTCRVLRTLDFCRLIRTTWCPHRTIWFEEGLQCARTELPEIDPGILQEIDPRELAVLHQELLLQVAQVEALEQKVAESMIPQNVQEIEMLETKFQAALGELGALKGRIKKG
jgi:hypothetical protein